MECRQTKKKLDDDEESVSQRAGNRLYLQGKLREKKKAELREKASKAGAKECGTKLATKKECGTKLATKKDLLVAGNRLYLQGQQHEKRKAERREKALVAEAKPCRTKFATQKNLLMASNRLYLQGQLLEKKKAELREKAAEAEANSYRMNLATEKNLFMNVIRLNRGGCFSMGRMASCRFDRLYDMGKKKLHEELARALYASGKHMTTKVVPNDCQRHVYVLSNGK